MQCCGSYALNSKLLRIKIKVNLYTVVFVETYLAEIAYKSISFYTLQEKKKKKNYGLLYKYKKNLHILSVILKTKCFHINLDN